MRVLSRAEAVAVQRLLAHTDLTEGDGRGPDRLPRRTAQAIRQRAYVRGWITDRYVPNPLVLGYRSALFLVARPFSERAAPTLEQWRSHPRAVLVWASPELLFGVFAARSPEEAIGLQHRLADEKAVRVEVALQSELTSASVPVYFDFEAAWSDWCGLSGTIRYPRALPAGDGEEPNGHALRPAERAALGGLLLAPFVGATPGRGVSRLSRRYRAERRWLKSGHVEFRSFLNPREVSRWVSRFADQAVFVHGRLRGARDAPSLFHALVEECKVGPFLFVTDGRAVLWGALAKGDPRSPARSPIPRAPVLPTVQRYLEGIRIVRESLSHLEFAVDHRYERLLPEESFSPA